MFNERKRKFLDQYSSSFVQPSKYLILSPEEDDVVASEEEQSLVDQGEEGASSTRKIGKIPSNQDEAIIQHSKGKLIVDDCWGIVFEFLEDVQDRKNLIFVCKSWARLLIPQFIDYCRKVYDKGLHLEKIKIAFEECGDGGAIIQSGLFTELASWKAPLCYDDLEEEYSGLNWDVINENQAMVEFEGSTYRQKILPFGVPLCKGTISDQYELVSSDIDCNTYRNMVEKFMGIQKSEQGVLSFNPFELSDKIKQEEEMVDVYVDEIQESIDVDTTTAIYTNDIVYSGDDYYNSEQCNSDFTFYALRSGIQRLTRRGGVKYFEPTIVEDYLYELKKVIHLVLKDAYERKFPNKTDELDFEETSSQYDRYCVDLSDKSLPTFDDLLDTDLKLNHEEILESFERVTGMKISYAPEIDPYDLDIDGLKSNHKVEPIETEGPKLDDENGNNDNKIDRDDSAGSEEEITDDESTSSDEDEMEDQPEVITEENFIDDSEVYTFDLENLGNSLMDQLMKVSIRVHEEVYGKERAHKEKLFLNNWYGAGDLFFKNCSKEFDNPLSMQVIILPKEEEEVIVELNEEPVIEQGNQEENQLFNSSLFTKIIEEDLISVEGEFDVTEEDNLKSASKEDLEYFGYSLYDDDFDEFPIFDGQDDSDKTLEQSSEGESLKYQLRRMLREQSYDCITNFFSSNNDGL